MSWALLAFATVCFLGSMAVVVRGRNLGPMTAPYFVVGLLVGELIPHLVAVEAIIAVVLTAAGALDRTAGQFGLALLAASWVVLAVAQNRAVAAEPVLRRALREGLGIADDNPGELGAVRTYVPYVELVVPFRTARPDVECLKDLPYGDGGHRHHLDLYRPRSRVRPSPVLLQIHGGGWTSGDKGDQAKPLMNLLASRGWGCVAANYRLGPEASFPDHIVDVKRAIAWIRRRGAEYGLDPSFIAVTGGSAGGHLAALAALTAGQARLQPGFEEVDTSVAACIPFYGIYDFLDRDGAFERRSMKPYLERYVMKVSHADRPEAWDQASPISHVCEDAPPFFVIHGTHDSMAPVENARTFVDALRSVSKQPVLYAELPGAQHAFEAFHSLRTGHTINAVHRFLESTYADFRARRDNTDEP